MQVSVSVSVSTRNDQSRSQSRLLRLSGLSLSLESRPDKDLVSVSVSIPKILVSSAAALSDTMGTERNLGVIPGITFGSLNMPISGGLWGDSGGWA